MASPFEESKKGSKRFGSKVRRFSSFVRKRSGSLSSPVKEQTTAATTIATSPQRRHKSANNIAMLDQNHNNDNSSTAKIDGSSPPTSSVVITNNDILINNNKNNNRRQHSESDETTELTTDDNDSLSMVERSSKDDPLYNWCRDANALVTSQEMINFTLSSRELICTATFLMGKVVMLPITVPIHVVGSSTNFVVGSCSNVTSAIITAGGRRGNNSNSGAGQDTSSSLSSWNALRNVAGHIIHDVRSTVLDLVAPGVFSDNTTPYNRRYVVVNPQCYSSSASRSAAAAGQSSSEEQDSFLDRLRLDYPTSLSSLEEEEDEEYDDEEDIIAEQSLPETFSNKNTNRRSEFLLHVTDVGIVESSSSLRLCYVDLKPIVGDGDNYINQALDILAINALALFSNNDVCRISSTIHQGNTNNETTSINKGKEPEVLPVQWKPEGSTQKLLKKRKKMSSSSLSNKEWTTLLEREVFVWSGSFIGGIGRQFPLFLARSIVPGSPKDILRLLWDNNRVSVYNKFNLGRTDKLNIGDDNILDDIKTTMGVLPPLKGTKVISSETSVPFTKITVTISALMHATPLYDSNGTIEGYMILSRSLNKGRAGCHVQRRRRRKQQVHDHQDHDNAIDKSNGNEIMWGINVMRCIPNQPNKSDFYSLSHVATGLVPGFIGRKIGMMGIDDFFSAIKSLHH